MLSAMRFLGLSLLVAAACAVPDVTIENAGQGCVYASPDDNPLEKTVFGAGAAVEIRIRMWGSPCGTDFAASCAIDREGSRLIVMSEKSWNEPSSCHFLEPTILTAQCSTPELEPGTYTIGFADATTTLAIPSEVTPPCFFSPTGY